MLYYLRQEVIGDQAEKILDGADSRLVRAHVSRSKTAAMARGVGGTASQTAFPTPVTQQQRISLLASRTNAVFVLPAPGT